MDLWKSRKAFTLIELLAVIVILGIIATTGIFSYSKYLKNAKLRYYNGQERMLVLSARDYFTDYLSKLPKEVGSETSVSLEELYFKKYISRLKDYSGKICENKEENKVYAYKKSINNYQYYVNINCNGYKFSGKFSKKN